MKNQWHKLGLNLQLGMFVLGLVLLELFAGCSSTPNVKEARDSVRVAYELQKPVVIQTSKTDDRPDWTKNSASESDSKMYFSGGFLNGSDYSLTVRCANAEAVKVAVQGIGQYIRTEFTEYVQGPNTGSGGVERYVEDGIGEF